MDNIDVFCEEGVFNVEQTRRILTAGTQIGLAINFHGEELHRLNSAEVKCSYGSAHELCDWWRCGVYGESMSLLELRSFAAGIVK